MSLLKRPGSPFWYISHRFDGDAKPTRVSTRIPHTAGSREQTRDNYRAAQNLESKFILKDPATWERLMGAPLQAQGETFAEYLVYWREHFQPEHAGSRSEDYRLAWWIIKLGAMPMGAITEDVMITLRTERLATRRAGTRPYPFPKPQTVNREVSIIQAIIAGAARLQRVIDPETGKPLRVSPLALLEPLKPKGEAIPTALTAEDEDRLLDVITDPTDRALLLMGIDTLQREGDLLDFERKHDKGRWLFFPDVKNGSLHRAPCSSRLRAALDAVPVDPTDPEHVFARRRHAVKHNRPAVIARLFQKYCKAAGVTYGRKHAGVTWHRATRATGATRLSANGYGRDVIKKLGGWKSDSQPGRYIVPEEELLQRAVEDMDRGAKVVQMKPKSA
jgi:hypothetical protein